ncbi:hypothetical protein AN639_12310 [Candidatus Epulonipiscium fishelsonii]|nr:hypothetical protein AN639_12310 [Epulopiscium sp. SCG-B05WGA-EpuloA1]
MKKAAPFTSRLKMRDNLYILAKVRTEDYKHRVMEIMDYGLGPTTCKQSLDAKCMHKHVQLKLYADETLLVRMIKMLIFVLCGACHKMRVHGMPTVDPETNKSPQNVTCGACALVCPTGALSIVKWSDVVSAL